MDTRPAYCCLIRRSSAIMIVLLLLAIVNGCAAQRSVLQSVDQSSAEPSMMEASVSNETAPADLARKVIASARMELIVEDTEPAVDSINALVAEVGGYVSQANLYRDTYGGRNLLRGTLTLRVPVEELETTLAKLESLAVEVRSKSVDREDVTDQYSDVEAQLRNLEATENELRELLSEVRARPNSSSEDILAVHRDLTEIRGEIEQLQGRKNMLDNLIALSTIELTLIPDAANRPVVAERWRPATVVRDAARALVSSLQFIGSLIIWLLVYLMPILVIFLIILLLAVWIIRTLVVRRRRNRKAEEPAETV